jgi:hypothetical protein
MVIVRKLSVAIACALAGTALARPALATSADATERAPLEFRLHHPETAASRDHDIWEPSDPSLLLRVQQELSVLQPSKGLQEDPRHAFGDMVLAGVTTLPVVGQFANHDWLKGLLVLGTGAGLTAGIVLGNQRNDAELTRLGTLGLYPLVLFSMLDAFVTAQSRKSAAPSSPAAAR